MSGEKAREGRREAGTIDSGALHCHHVLHTLAKHTYTTYRRHNAGHDHMRHATESLPPTAHIAPGFRSRRTCSRFSEGEVVGPCSITKALPPLSLFLQSKTAQEVAVFGYKRLCRVLGLPAPVCTQNCIPTLHSQPERRRRKSCQAKKGTL